MGQTKVQRLIKAFKASGKEESERFEMDNLDRAKLVRSKDYEQIYGNEVMVENEHGTLFPVSDLSDVEIMCFLSEFIPFTIHQTQAKVKPKAISKEQIIAWIGSDNQTFENVVDILYQVVNETWSVKSLKSDIQNYEI